jgi:hypothetical protein
MTTPSTAGADPDFNAMMELVNANGELMLSQMREVRLQCDRTEATLRLIVGMLAASTDTDAAYMLFRVARDLRTCASRPDLAAQLACCEERCIEPAMLLAAASVIYGDERPEPRAELPASQPATTSIH